MEQGERAAEESRAPEAIAMSLRYDAILFDFDGVLVDSEPLHWECWREVLGSIGIDLSWTFYTAHCIGAKDDDMGELLDLAHFAELLDAKRELFRRRAPAAGLVTAEVKELLGSLMLPLAVVTSSSRLEVEPVLAAGGIHHHFAACVYRESVVSLKPDPEPYRTAAKMLPARHPLVVEDSEPGVASAAAAGFDCLRIRRPRDLPGLLRRSLTAGPRA